MPNALDTDITEDDAPELEAPEAEPEVQAEPAQEVSVQRTPITRRQKAADRDASIMKELRETREQIAKQVETHAQEVARLAREQAEFRGQVHGYMSQPRENPRREEQAEDPKQILREANALLDNKDFTGYQERYSDYVLAKQAQDPRFRPQQQQPQGQGVSPMLQAVMSQYVDVVSDQDALDLAQAADRRLARKGIPEGPQRWKLAFEEGRRYLGPGAQKTPQFDRKGAGALAGVPTARNGTSGGGGEPGVTLTPIEKMYAKKMKVSEVDYAKELSELHPDRIERG